jgi:hypothetical protein
MENIAKKILEYVAIIEIDVFAHATLSGVIRKELLSAAGYIPTQWTSIDR